MPRTRRTDLTHPLLHVYSRGADRQDIFSTDHDRALFERLLGDVDEHFGVSIHAAALMHNHVHLIVDRSGGDISRAMQHLFGRYARTYNERHGRTGPLFTGRFGITEITSDEQLVQCSRYVHLNPVEFVPLTAICAYRWSSLSVYAGRRPAPPWLSIDLIPSVLHESPEQYVEFVLTPQPGDQHGRPMRPWVVLTRHDVDVAVGDLLGTRPSPSERGRPDTPRQMAIGAAAELRIADAESIAQHHGMTAPASVRTAARRTRVLVEQDEVFARRYRLVIAQLRATAAQAGLPPKLRPAS